MTRQRLLNLLGFVLLLVVIAHFAATVYNLYWRVLWFDHIPHFLGGAFVTLLICWVCFFSGYLHLPMPSSRLALFGMMVGGALAIGIGWEVFENLLGMTASPKGYWLDTELDLLFDTFGALAAYFFIRGRL